MKPFNLEQALAGRPVVTRDGKQKGDQVHEFNLPNGEKWIALVLGGALCIRQANGQLFRDGTKHSSDLFMDPVKRTVWVNFLQYGLSYYYPSKEHAQVDAEGSLNKAIAIAVPVEIEEEG